ILAASGVRIILINILGIENIFLHILAGTIFGVLLPLLCYVIAININLNKYLYGRDSIRRKICCR
ncbi:hypothetical protein, partial [Desulforamulus ruminis]|uniref:hypothetical protein n=1 Tax=Desulforamulus ruminis TaxID=1564 RepID=UPI0023526DDB